MKSLKKRIQCPLIFVLAGCLFLSTVPTAQGFIAHEHHGFQSINWLIKKIDKPYWVIGYRYEAKCPPEDRQNGKALEEAITVVLQAWLAPLRELHPARPITDDFRYVLQPDFNTDDHLGDDNFTGLLSVDLRVSFECRQAHAFALVGSAPPDVFIREGTEVNLDLMSILVHELGHAFGFADVYTIPTGEVSTGGLTRTIGTQPSSVMAVNTTANHQPPYLGEDDRRGIIWLYKHFYDGLAVDDCFFADYVYEPDPAGCRPKYPLIFEVRYAQPIGIALRLLDEDPSIDLNIQDNSGRTALHYAVIRGDTLLFRGGLTTAGLGRTNLYDGLLSYKDLDVNIRDADGRTAIEEALKRGHSEIVTLLLTVPDIRRPLGGDGDTLTTTWGALKLER